MLKRQLFLFMLIAFVALPQSDGGKILEQVKKKFNAIKDYEVDVKIKIDVEFLKVPDNDATLYYKAPDKVTMKTGDKFALMPKEGLNFNPANLLNGKYTSVLEGDAKINGKPHYIAKVIPMGGDGNVVLSTLWIDKSSYFISRVETTTKNSGTFQLDMVYPANSKYPLPSSMTFSFEVGKFNFPKGFGGNKKEKNPASTNTPGKVYITYKNYKINKGIPDSIFKKK